MASAVESNKAKIAKRVVEVLDYFDDAHPHATVMDIVRRYNRPQSSTSELLSSLVDLGLLYKDPYSRSYSLTPRAAMMGASAQPDIIRNGNLNTMVDRLVAQTGLSVGVFGMVGLNVQLFSHKAGTHKINTSNPKGVSCGLQEQLSNSAAGWLLLSTIPTARREAMIRRLNAEAMPEKKFSNAEMAEQIAQCGAQGAANGIAGFGTIADACCVLLPGQPESQPIALGFIYEPGAHVQVETLVECLRDGVRRTLNPEDFGPSRIALVSSAA